MPSQTSRRVGEFDSLRGLAAFSVVLFHYVLLLKGADGATYRQIHAIFWLLGKTPLGLLWSGHAAVMLFFVLSGFVLYLMLERTKLSYSAYVVRRVSRLYLPYLAAVVLGVIGEAFLYSGRLDGLGHWINGFWSWPITASTLGNHVLVLGQFNADRYDFTIWSLVHEMRISLLFPLLFVLVWRWPWWRTFAAALALSAAAGVARVAWFSGWTEWGQALMGGGMTAYSRTIHYLFPFAVGALLARHRDVLRAAYLAGSPRLRTACMLAGASLYLYGERASDWLLGTHLMIPSDWSIIAGASLVLVIAMSDDAAKQLLNRRAFRYLGRISYSLYLLHPIVLLAALHAFNGRLPLWAILAGGFAITFPVADLAQRMIEQPAARLGRRAADYVSRERMAPPREAYDCGANRRSATVRAIRYDSGKDE